MHVSWFKCRRSVEAYVSGVDTHERLQLSCDLANDLADHGAGVTLCTTLTVRQEHLVADYGLADDIPVQHVPYMSSIFDTYLEVRT